MIVGTEVRQATEWPGLTHRKSAPQADVAPGVSRRAAPTSEQEGATSTQSTGLPRWAPGGRRKVATDGVDVRLTDQTLSCKPHTRASGRAARRLPRCSRC